MNAIDTNLLAARRRRLLEKKDGRMAPFQRRRAGSWGLPGATLGPNLVFGPLEFLRELLVPGPAIDESLVNRATDVRKSTGRLHNRLD